MRFKTQILILSAFCSLKMVMNGMDKQYRILTPVTFDCGKRKQGIYWDPAVRDVFLHMNKSGEKILAVIHDASKDNFIHGFTKAWDCKTGKEIELPVWGKKKVGNACFGATDNIVMRHDGHNVYLYDFTTKKETLLHTNNNCISIMFVDNQSRLYLGHLNGEVTRLIGNNSISMGTGNISLAHRVKALCYNEQQSYIAAIHYNDIVNVFDFEKNMITSFSIQSTEWRKKEFDNKSHRICCSEDGNVLLAINSDFEIYKIDLQTATASLHQLTDAQKFLAIRDICFDRLFKTFRLLFNDIQFPNLYRLYNLDNKEILKFAYDLTCVSATIDQTGNIAIISYDINNNISIDLFPQFNHTICKPLLLLLSLIAQRRT